MEAELFKNTFLTILLGVLLMTMVSCDLLKKEPTPKLEKLVYTESELGNCKCINSEPVCYYDTAKTYLMILNDITGKLGINNSYGPEYIQIENAPNYITGPSEIYTDRFYLWKLLNGGTWPCNFPSSLNKKEYLGSKVKLSCKVFQLKTPRSPSEHPGEYPIILTKLEILK
jgi:hypothetical protein